MLIVGLIFHQLCLFGVQPGIYAFTMDDDFVRITFVDYIFFCLFTIFAFGNYCFVWVNYFLRWDWVCDWTDFELNFCAQTDHQFLIFITPTLSLFSYYHFVFLCLHLMDWVDTDSLFGPGFWGLWGVIAFWCCILHLIFLYIFWTGVWQLYLDVVPPYFLVFLCVFNLGRVIHKMAPEQGPSKANNR